MNSGRGRCGQHRSMVLAPTSPNTRGAAPAGVSQRSKLTDFKKAVNGSPSSVRLLPLFSLT